MSQFFQTSRKCIAINMWSPDWYYQSATVFDAKKLAAEVKQTGAEIVFTWQGFTQDHFGHYYYPTKMGPVHKNVKNGDFIGDFINELQQANIKVFAYYSYPDLLIWQQNADWRQKDSKQNDILFMNFGSLCVNSPYREFSIARQVEIAEMYPLDGFQMADSLQFGNDQDIGCYCEYCQRKYRQQFGMNLPVIETASKTDWLRFVNWRYDCITQYYQELSQRLRKANKEMTLTHFSFCQREKEEYVRGDNYESTTAFDDIITTIPDWAYTQNGQLVRHTNQIWKVGLYARYLKAISGKPVVMHMGRFCYDREYHSKPYVEIELSAWSALAAGAHPSIADNLFPSGAINHHAYQMIKDVFEQVDRSGNNVIHESLPHIAVYFSKRTHDYIGYVYPGENRTIYAFQSAYKTVMDAHLPVDVITERGTLSGELSQYKMLLLPETICLSTQEVNAIKKFVHEGGRIIATGATATVNENWDVQPASMLESVLGSHFISTLNYQYSYISVLEKLSAGLVEQDALPVRSDQVVAQPLATAEVLANIVLPATHPVSHQRIFTYGMDVPPERVSDYPAAVLYQAGKGSSLWFSANVFSAYGVYGYSQHYQMLLNSFKLLLGEPIMRTNAPKSVEFSYHADGELLLIHLVNYTTGNQAVSRTVGGDMADSVVTLHHIEINLDIGEKQIANFMYNGERIDYLVKDGRLIAVLPMLEVYGRVELNF